MSIGTIQTTVRNGVSLSYSTIVTIEGLPFDIVTCRGLKLASHIDTSEMEITASCHRPISIIIIMVTFIGHSVQAKVMITHSFYKLSVQTN